MASDLNALKDSVADLLIDVAKRRSREAAKRRRRIELDQARRIIEASKPAKPDRVVVNLD